ncbi:hypothetical protein C0995_012049 [Termitomyces sp. Mi166|nr:hypothetical protein C0995_012049 [Termitomyces sp. Mi166\
MRKFTLDSASAWTDSEPYKIGKRLLMTLLNRKETIEVEVVEMFPPTNSVALLVDILSKHHDISSRAILKLADRHFGDARKAIVDNPAWPWTIDSEGDFQESLRGYIQTHRRYPKLNADRIEDEPMWMRELRHWNVFHGLLRNERKAYSRLEDAQSRGYIPHFFDAARIRMSSE